MKSQLGGGLGVLVGQGSQGGLGEVGCQGDLGQKIGQKLFKKWDKKPGWKNWAKKLGENWAIKLGKWGVLEKLGKLDEFGKW